MQSINASWRGLRRKSNLHTATFCLWHDYVRIYLECLKELYDNCKDEKLAL